MIGTATGRAREVRSPHADGPLPRTRFPPRCDDVARRRAACRHELHRGAGRSRLAAPRSERHRSRGTRGDCDPRIPHAGVLRAVRILRRDRGRAAGDARLDRRPPSPHRVPDGGRVDRAVPHDQARVHLRARPRRGGDGDAGRRGRAHRPRARATVGRSVADPPLVPGLPAGAERDRGGGVERVACRARRAARSSRRGPVALDVRLARFCLDRAALARCSAADVRDGPPRHRDPGFVRPRSGGARLLRRVLPRRLDARAAAACDRRASRRRLVAALSGHARAVRHGGALDRLVRRGGRRPARGWPRHARPVDRRPGVGRRRRVAPHPRRRGRR